MEVAKGVHRQSLGVANWYVVEEGGRVTLVDAGTPADWDTLHPALGSIGRRPDEVEAILLTHAHSDHTGFAERARAELRTRVLIHPGDVERARGVKQPKNEAGFGRYLVRIEAYRTLFGLVQQKGMSVVPIAEVSTFADGETIDVPGRPRAIHVPGHTDGMSALLFEDRSVLCTGDALVMRNPLTGRVGPQIAPAGLNLSSDRAMQSLARLEHLGAETVLTGHGEPWTEGVAEAVRRARAAGPS